MKAKTEKPARLQLWRFIYGMPSAVAAVAFLSVVVAGAHTPKSVLLGKYRQAAESSLRNGELSEADVYYRKLAWLDRPNASIRYGLALTAERQGNLDRAAELMSQIAPTNRFGHGPAHYWQAQRLIPVVQNRNSRASVSTLEHHLLATLAENPDHSDAHGILGKIYHTTGRSANDAGLLRKAVKHLQRAARTLPKYKLELAGIHRHLGQKIQGDQWAEQFLEHYSKRLSDNANDLEAALRKASAEVFLAKFPEAVRTLKLGMQQSTDERFQNALVSTYISWFTALDPEQKDLLAKRLELLQKALTLDPDNAIVLTALAQVVTLSGPEADQAQEALQDSLVSGRAPASVHLILGMLAMRQQEETRADYHLKQAFALSPGTPEVLNSLAWFLAHRDPPKLERALALANKAVTQRPSKANYRETRGVVLMKLGRIPEAQNDLLMAVRKFPDRARIHEALAESYEKAGDDPMAERHRQRVMELSGLEQ